MDKLKYEVSIIIPINNWTKIEENGINSIIFQLKQSVQLIIIVNGLPDDKIIAIKNSFQDNQHILYLSLNYSNANSARLAGLDAALGNYVYYFDADDLLLPGSINLLLKYCKLNYDCVCFDFLRNRITDEIIDSSEVIYKRKLEVVKKINSTNKKDFFSKYPTHIVNKLFKRELLVGINVVNSPFFQDWYLSYSMAPKLKSIVLSNKILYIYNNHNKSNSHYNNMTIESLLNALVVYRQTSKNLHGIDDDLLKRFVSLFFIGWYGRLYHLFICGKISKIKFNKLRWIAVSRVKLFSFPAFSREFFVVAYNMFRIFLAR
jgi:glycosyltransferase involved in cell wall biosynthesis